MARKSKTKKTSYVLSSDAFNLTRQNWAIRLNESPPLTYKPQDYLSEDFTPFSSKGSTNRVAAWCDRALINLEGESGTQLGIDLLGRRYTTDTIRYFDIEMDYKPFTQVMVDDCTQMAWAFSLYLLVAYLFANIGQMVSLRWLALLRNFGAANWEQAVQYGLIAQGAEVDLKSFTLVKAHFIELSSNEVIWRPWAGHPLVSDPNLEAIGLVTSGITQPFEAGPTAGAFINPPHLPWSVYVYGPDDFAQECVVGCNANVMGYTFPRNLKLEVTDYPRQMYGPRWLAYPGDVDDGGSSSETTPNYQPRKRRFR
ncbi:hypothetical protein SO802_012525 [Lithocarpus litseifolius]|uniref:Uncharacterized protein n=1 Tax=Lithocarpus litseifolius TaxID=425828 RepID=A0AAW2D3T8_9ROSI